MCRKLRFSQKIFRSQPIPIEKMSRSKRETKRCHAFYLRDVFIGGWPTGSRTPTEITKIDTTRICQYKLLNKYVHRFCITHYNKDEILILNSRSRLNILVKIQGTLLVTGIVTYISLRLSQVPQSMQLLFCNIGLHKTYFH